jgi:hypothetical protein
VRIANINQEATDEIEILRLIIQNKQKHPVSYDEALEVGESLISYFKALADENIDEVEET